jgi:protein O-GlcNAc transferase
MTIKLSVLIPTYNRVHYLSTCLESVLVSDYQALEVIVSDNASPDNTPEVVRSFDDARLRYYRNETNIGPELNILRLFEYATGDYLFCLTDDDLMNPNAVPKTLQIIREYPDVGVILSALNQIDDRTGRATSNYVFYEEDRLFSAGQEALVALFRASHIFSRWTIRRDLVDLEGYKRQIGRHLYSPRWVAGMAMKRSPTYYTNTRLVTHRIYNKVYWEYPDDYMVKGMIEMIKELLPHPNEKETAEILIGQVISDTGYTLPHSLSVSRKAFLRHVASLVAVPEVRRSQVFWRNMLPYFPRPVATALRLVARQRSRFVGSRQ